MKTRILSFLVLLPFLAICQEIPTFSDLQRSNNTLPSNTLGVMESNGKINIPVNLGTIDASGSLSYPIGIIYNGQNIFKQAQYQNQYAPTGVLGLGWGFGVPKIIADIKQSATREDDTFYIQDGDVNSKLFCIDKGVNEWKFQAENFVQWIITYNLLDKSWTVIKDDGIIYEYGKSDTSDSRVYVSTWGNWIGDSNKTPTGTVITEWCLTKIKDLWDNNISFYYDSTLMGQNVSQVSNKHSESNYLKEIISSSGNKVEFNYSDKQPYEYYEPHTEQIEPDAYQERYEKKYLQSMRFYDYKSQPIYDYIFNYTLSTETAFENRKRYLTKIEKTIISNNITINISEYEYYLSGIFKGGIKKVSSALGSSTIYNYKEKTLLDEPKIGTGTPEPGYEMLAVAAGNNYTLKLRLGTPESTNYPLTKLTRLTSKGVNWTREDWDEYTFTFPYSVNYHNLEQHKFILSEDFYASMTYENNYAKLYLWHRNSDGITWDEKIITGVDIGGGEPSFINGDDFVAIGSHYNGKLHTYAWNGKTWNYKLINQGTGQYYFGATNNFILSLDEDGGTDMITNIVHEDNYYIHYLDIKKHWQTKSWSAAADPSILGIEKPSYFYPGNTIAGFVADDNPELFLRWDSNYNLIGVDDILGWYNDKYPITNISNSIFSIHKEEPNSYGNSPSVFPILNMARFNGVNWIENDIDDSKSDGFPGFGLDKIITADKTSYYGSYRSTSTPLYTLHTFDANSNLWNSQLLNTYSTPNTNTPNYLTTLFTNNFFMTGDEVYKLTSNGYSFDKRLPKTTINMSDPFMYEGISNGNIIMASIIDSGPGDEEEKRIIRLNKITGSVEIEYINENISINNKFLGLGGLKPRISKNIFCSDYAQWALKIIDDNIRKPLKDIVLDNVVLNDDNGNQTITFYNYNKFNMLPDNNTVIYGEVVIENKGYAIGNVGKTIKNFDNGSKNVQNAGALLEELTINSNNVMVKKIENTWKTYEVYANNGVFNVGVSKYGRLLKQKEILYFDSSLSTSNEITNDYYTYPSYLVGYLKSKSKTESDGSNKMTVLDYASSQYSFMRDKNMLSFPFNETIKNNSSIFYKKQSKWKLENNIPILEQNLIGNNLSLRINNSITKVDDKGNILEGDNGKGLFKTTLYGYNNLFEVATLQNANYQEIVNELDVTYTQLQTLNTASLKVELLKLYGRLPNAMISLSFYDNQGRVINSINERQEETYLYYDTFGREDYITDAQGNVLEKKVYHFAN